MRFLWTRAERDPITVAIKNPMEEVVIEEVIPDLFLMQSLVDGKEYMGMKTIEQK